MTFRLKDLFGPDGSNQTVERSSQEEFSSKIESTNYLEEYTKHKNRVIPQIDLNQIESFVKYGSAKKYFEDSINRVLQTYPYDGSGFEKLKWENQSTFLDLHVFNTLYPKTNGHIILSSEGWGSVNDTQGDYKEPVNHEYIFVSGAYADKNILDEKRGNNLELDPDNGNVVEFWFKKESYGVDTREVILDIHNSELSSSDSYGRFRIEITGSSPTFLATYMSGTSGFSNEPVGYLKTDGWHHYAFRLANESGDTKLSFYLDGRLFETITAPSSVSKIDTENANASIGSLFSTPSGSAYHGLDLKGYGKLSGSLDEFRFWKVDRTSRDIGRNYFTQVDGGTNLDNSNYGLTFYLKFNEGITGYSSIDKYVTDYSGRKMDFQWVNYPGSTARSTDSAIVLSGRSSFETKDPILALYKDDNKIFSAHPDVQSLYNNKIKEGEAFDDQNPSSIIHSIPSWIVEEDRDYEAGELENLVQILASYFDTLHFQVDGLYNIKEVQYVEGDNGTEDTNFKPFPFANRMVESLGFPAPEIFVDSDILDFFKARGEDRLYRNKLYDIKNTIYQNIYNNLALIYKTKGTEKSFRNLLHCYGIDEELVKVNVYSDNDVLDFRDRYKDFADKKKYANFFDRLNNDAVILQNTSLSVSPSLEYISGSQEFNKLGFTAEAEAFFSKPPRERSDLFYLTPVSCSLFGAHTPDVSALPETTWDSSDNGSFQVYAVKGYKEGSAKFVLSSSSGVFNSIETEDVEGVFEDTRVCFSVRVSPNRQPQSYVGTTNYLGTSDTTYNLEFMVVKPVIDDVSEVRKVTSSLDQTAGENLISSHKRFYMGAHRQDFTGSVLQKSYADISSLKFWIGRLTDEEVNNHARDPFGYGLGHAQKNKFLYQRGGTQTSDSFVITGSSVPYENTLVMNWDLQSTSSFSPGYDFSVVDFSSGSHGYQYGVTAYNDLVNRHHEGVGFGFGGTEDIKTKRIQIAKRKLPEIINTNDMVNIVDETEEKIFSSDDQPVNYFIAVEKSIYQNISEEMVNTLSSVKAFNNLIGEPVNRYRGEYKKLEKMRSNFFKRVESDIDVERFYDFYKWFDYSISRMIGELIPASSKSSAKINNVIESHIFERNKYRNKFPTIDSKTGDFEGVVQSDEAGDLDFRTIEGALLINGWPINHAPPPASPPPQNKFSVWWRTRAEKDTITISSGDTTLDTARQNLFNAILSSYKQDRKRPAKFNVVEVREMTGGQNDRSNKKRDFYKGNLYGPNVEIDTSQIKRKLDTTDFQNIRKKEKVLFDYEEDNFSGSGHTFSPFDILIDRDYDSSIHDDGRLVVTVGTEEYIVTNIHDDSVSNGHENATQSPFTRIHVGAMPHRKQFLNPGTDNDNNRLEGVRVVQSGSSLVIKNNPLTERSYIRDAAGARRVYNTKNIKHTSGSFAGNYQNDYEVVHTNGRFDNNQWFRDTEGGSSEGYSFSLDTDMFSVLNPSASATVGGLLEYKKPERFRAKNVFVSRFSSPGGPESMGDTNGGPGLDSYAAEYSVYNTVNYRNLKARTFLNRVSSQHCGPAGFSSFEPHTSSWYTDDPFYSFHKTNRNPRTRMQLSGSSSVDYVTGTLYDNHFVHSAIPAQDYGYSWITASATGTKDVHGYAQESSDLTFISSSDIIVQMSGWGAHADEYNYGRYGWPTWRQVRVGNNPIARDDKRNNTFSIYQEYYTNTGDTNRIVTQKRIKSYTEPLITSRYRPLAHDIIMKVEGLKGDEETRHYEIKSTFGNNKARFANHLLNKNIYLDEKDTDHTIEMYDKLISMYNNDDFVFNSLSYREVVYPREVNTYLNRTRGREVFTYSGIWNTNESERYTDSAGIESTTGKFIPTQSIWPLDARKDFATVAPGYASEEDGAGELQNAVTTFHSGNKSSVFASPMYARRIPEFAGVIPETFIFNSTNKTAGAGREDVISSFGTVWDPGNIPYFAFTSSCSALLSTSAVYKFYMGDPTGWSTVGTIGGLPWNNLGGTINLQLTTGSGTPLQNLSSSYDNVADAIEVLFPFVTTSRYSGSLEGEQIMITSSCPGLLSANIVQESGYFKSTTTDAWIFYPTGSTSGVQSIGSLVGDAGTLIFPGDTKWEAATQSGKDPYYTSYSAYAEAMRYQGKEYGVLPEFRMSEHLGFYMTGSANGDFLYNKDDIYTITGAVNDNSGNSTFCKEYLHSDFMKHFRRISDDHRSAEKSGVSPTKLSLDEIVLTCKGYKKFLPYEGLYPAQRTLQIIKDFTRDYEETIIGSGSDTDTFPKWRPIFTPLFAPGVLYNSIKSGIGVDYPVYTGAYTKLTDNLNSSFNFRFPFESILSPESYIGDTYIWDQEPHPSASMDMQTKISGVPGQVYSIAMHNFLAETVNFFLDDQVNKTISSRPQEIIKIGDKDKYQMRIKLSKDDNLTMYDRPSAFGPPSTLWVSGNAFNCETCSETGSAYTPFTPSYYDGASYATITFPADGVTLEDKGYTISQMKKLVSIEYTRGGITDTGIDSAGLAYTDCMNIDASINIFDSLRGEEIKRDESKIYLAPTDNVDAESWVISTKFEAPVLNFATVSRTQPATGSSGSTSKGMWHQYGSVPSPKEAIRLSIEGPEPGYDQTLTGSLKDLLGFNQSSVVVGEVTKDYREVKEGVVAIPFIVKGDGEKYFFNIPQEAMDFLEKVEDKGYNIEELYKKFETLEKEAHADSLGDLFGSLPEEGVPHPSLDKIRKSMKDYVFPPAFDFVKFKGKVKPVVMFVFEFRHRFSQQDITNIWQNLMPENTNTYGPFESANGDETESVISTVSHPSLANAFFNPSLCDENLRWMVFKVKQRAVSDYRDVCMVKDRIPAPPDSAMGYSYNWPYDYFSLVELVNIEADAVFGKQAMLTEDVSKLNEEGVDKDKLGLNFGDLLKDKGV